MDKIGIPEHKRFFLGNSVAEYADDLFTSIQIGNFRLVAVDNGEAIYQNPNSKGAGFSIAKGEGTSYLFYAHTDISYGDIADLLDILFEKHIFLPQEMRDAVSNQIPGVGWVIRNDIEQALIVKTSADMAVAVTFPMIVTMDKTGCLSYYNPQVLVEAIERLCV